MSESIGSVLDWAAHAFPEAASTQRLAARMIEEASELVTETVRTKPDGAAIVDECADVAILAMRTVDRLSLDFQLGDRGGRSGATIMLGLPRPPVDLATEVMRRCCAVMNWCSLVQEFGTSPSRYTMQTFTDEIADFLECLCRKHGTTLQAAVDAKMAVLRERRYFKDENGRTVRDKAVYPHKVAPECSCETGTICRHSPCCYYDEPVPANAQIPVAEWPR